MSMTENGISTTTANGQEQYEVYTVPARLTRNRKPRKMCQYDYRHTDGKLFSCTAPSLEDCRGKRDAWLALQGA